MGTGLRLSSEIVDFELDKISDLERKNRIYSMRIFPTIYVMADDARIARGEFLQNKGFDVYDALHLSCAEFGRADVMLTTDDRLIRLAKRHVDILGVRVENPLVWLQELLP